MQLKNNTLVKPNKLQKKIENFLISFGLSSFLIFTIIYLLDNLFLLNSSIIINTEGLFFFGSYLGIISLLLISKKLKNINKIIFYSLISILFALQ